MTEDQPTPLEVIGSQLETINTLSEALAAETERADSRVDRREFDDAVAQANREKVRADRLVALVEQAPHASYENGPGCDALHAAERFCNCWKSTIHKKES